MSLPRLARPAIRPGLITRRHELLRRSLFGWSFPTPSDLPLAGTTQDGSGIPFLLIAEVLVGLPAALWTYKCLMMVLFQRRIIYLPSIPPGTRNETLDNEGIHPTTKAQLNGLDWQEVELESEAPSRWLRRKVKLSGIQLEWKSPSSPISSLRSTSSPSSSLVRPHVAILYLQGNAGTPLLRLPLFRKLLAPERPHATPSPTHPTPRLTLLALAPRSFWRSTRSKPTEAALLADYAAGLAHIRRVHPDAKVVLYGHSLGGAAALHLVERIQRGQPAGGVDGRLTDGAAAEQRGSAGVAGVVLENPMPSVATMVKALYPQKWLPYHYLGPLAFDRWDSLAAMRAPFPEGKAAAPRPPSLWLRSGGDEIIEEAGVREMYGAYKEKRKGQDGDVTVEQGGEVADCLDRWVECPGALHDTAYLDRRWRAEIRAFVERVAGEAGKGAST